MLPNMDRNSQTNALNRETHMHEKTLTRAFRSGKKNQSPAHTLRACLVKVRCLLFQQCALCGLPAVSPAWRSYPIPSLAFCMDDVELFS